MNTSCMQAKAMDLLLSRGKHGMLKADMSDILNTRSSVKNYFARAVNRRLADAPQLIILAPIVHQSTPTPCPK